MIAVLGLLACTPSPDPDTVPTRPTTTGGSALQLELTPHPERVTELSATATLEVAEALDLRCVGDDDPAELFRASSPTAAVHTFTFFGLLPDAPYTCTATSARGLTTTVSVHTGPWTDAPELAVEGDPEAVDGAYTVFNVGDLCRSDFVNTLWVADPEGRLRWRWRNPDEGVPDIDATWLGDRFLIGGGAGIFGVGNGAIREVDLAGEVLYERLDPATGTEYNHHTERLDDGTDLAVVWQINSGIHGKFVGFGIERTDPVTGAVLFDWNSQTAVDRGQLPSGAESSDAFHANAVRWTPDDPEGPAYWVSLAQLANVIRIDATSGDVTTRIGVGGDWTIEDTGDPIGDGWFDFQHAIRLDFAADPPILRMHDNGYAYGRTRALDLALDREARVATVAWQHTEEGWYEYPGGDHDVLPGGHRLLTQGHCDCCRTGVRDSTISEVDPETDAVVWRLRFASGDAWLYRSQRVDGCTLFDNVRYCAE